jgi:predicted Zn-dependent protease
MLWPRLEPVIRPVLRTAGPALLLATAVFSALVPAFAAPPDARNHDLPELGSSANTLLSPAKQREYGELTLNQLRHYGYVLDDPLLNGWLDAVGDQLGASSDTPEQHFTFFLIRDRQINAFATLGGYIGVNAGLVLAADDEDEVAGVLSHEIAHVTQGHMLRAVERAQRDNVPILLAMLGAMAVAGASKSSSADNAAIAAMASAQGLAVQRQIDFSRDNEAEADRIGIRTLARSGYDPEAMAEFFGKLLAVSRANQGGERERTPDYLQTHPVTTVRISEAEERAQQLSLHPIFRTTAALPGPGNPLLPGNLSPVAAGERGDTGDFAWARERLRVLSADTPDRALREYADLARRHPLDDAERYGQALARLQAGQATAAHNTLVRLLTTHPNSLWLGLATADAEARTGQWPAAEARLDALHRRLPDNRALALTWAQLLNERGSATAGQRAQALLRPLLANGGNDPVLQAAFARASDLAGDPIRAGEAWAEVAWLNGRPEQALVQLRTLHKRPDLDYYARARIEARIAAITPKVLDLREQGIHDRELDPNSRVREATTFQTVGADDRGMPLGLPPR